MKEYEVEVYWTEGGTVGIHAASLEEAEEKARQMPLAYLRRLGCDYVADSLVVESVTPSDS